MWIRQSGLCDKIFVNDFCGFMTWCFESDGCTEDCLSPS